MISLLKEELDDNKVDLDEFSGLTDVLIDDLVTMLVADDCEFGVDVVNGSFLTVE